MLGFSGSRGRGQAALAQIENEAFGPGGRRERQELWRAGAFRSRVDVLSVGLGITSQVSDWVLAVVAEAAKAAAAATALGFASRGVSAAAAARAWYVQMAG